MQEVNLIQTLSKNFALYGGWGRIHSDAIKHTNNVAQVGIIGKAALGSKVDVYGKLVSVQKKLQLGKQV